MIQDQIQCEISGKQVMYLPTNNVKEKSFHAMKIDQFSNKSRNETKRNMFIKTRL